MLGKLFLLELKCCILYTKRPNICVGHYAHVSEAPVVDVLSGGMLNEVVSEITGNRRYEIWS